MPKKTKLTETKPVSKSSKKSENSDLVQHSIWGEYAVKLKKLLVLGYSFGTYQGNLGVAGFYYKNGTYNLFPKEFRTPEDAIRGMVDYFLKNQ